MKKLKEFTFHEVRQCLEAMVLVECEGNGDQNRKQKPREQELPVLYAEMHT